MSNQPPTKPVNPNDPKTYPVKNLTFASPTNIPGASGLTELRGDSTQENTKRWVIEFIPSLRHHRVTCYEPGKEVAVRMVHESMVKAWEPMP